MEPGKELSWYMENCSDIRGMALFSSGRYFGKVLKAERGGDFVVSTWEKSKDWGNIAIHRSVWDEFKVAEKYEP
jgi:hypothetical protein